jgi:membrane associated rhomboid family serine protease
MRYQDRYRFAGYSSGFFPPGVKWLLISNTALFVLYFVLARSELAYVFDPFRLTPNEVFGRLRIWQPVTYLFLHDPFGFGHILFNMLALWMFGTDLESTWGTRRFLNYYFLCGIGAGLCDVVASWITQRGNVPTIGASGAIYGLLLAFGILFPHRTVLLIIFPIPARYFVMIVGAMTFMSSVYASGSGVSHVAHLGGMVFGYLYLRSRFATFDFTGLRRSYETWKLRRARRKFEVYMKKKGPDRGPWVH